MLYRDEEYVINQRIIMASGVLLSVSGLGAALTLWGILLEFMQVSSQFLVLTYSKMSIIFLLIKAALPLASGKYLWQKRQGAPHLIYLALTVAALLFVIPFALQVYCWLLEVRN